ncbi:MAG: ABC-type Fe3+-hydroxamate transport system, periplasmic component [Eubacterium sp.]|jgi:iron complex transport system substrate-binding protein|nr:ABC-type Fe3+-hydroxamate transport system, periplasmic component [Eubacterium sp.]
MKIKVLSIFMVMLLALGILTGCGQQNTAADSTLQAVETAALSTAAAQSGTAAGSTLAVTDTKATKYPLTLTDANGATVTINAKPVKIVALPLGTCEMLLSIADKSEIAGMTHFVDDPALSNVAEAAKGAGQRLDLNVERIIALQPDLVFTDTWSDEAVIKQLRDAKINVYQASVPSNIDQEKEMLKLLGNITDNTAKAEEVINWMDQKLKEISDKLATLKDNQKLSIVDYSEMGSTSGKNTNFDDLVARAGLVNPVSKEGLDGWPQLSKEMIVKYNPDILNLPSWFYDTSKSNPDALAKAIKADKALAGVKAVKNNKLFLLPYKHLSTTSQYSVLAVEDMAKAAYPELFK